MRPEGQPSAGEKVYCLFCRTGQERDVVAQVNSRAGLEALFPMKVKTECRSGHWVCIEKPLLPGYVFVYTQGEADVGPIRWLPSVVRLLSYDDAGAALRGCDLEFAQWVMRVGGVIGLSKAIREGDRVKIVEGPLRDLGGMIVAVDKRKRIAKLQLNVGGGKLVWLSFDYLK